MGFFGDSFVRLAKLLERGNPDLRTGKSYTRMPPEHAFTPVGKQNLHSVVDIIFPARPYHDPYRFCILLKENELGRHLIPSTAMVLAQPRTRHKSEEWDQAQTSRAAEPLSSRNQERVTEGWSR